MTTRLVGTMSWSGGRDAEGHRNYTIVHRVESNNANDGPAVVLATVGLPIPGQFWLFGGEVDIWAWCHYETEVEPEISDGEPNYWWKVTNHFSTKPPEGRARTHDPASTREDPLLEPPKISGGFNKKSVEITHDRFGRAIRNSAHEPIKGPEVEFDQSHPTVTIEFNTLILNLPLYAYMRDTLNDRTLWGMPKRTVRLADVSWERRYWSNTFIYYSVKFVFEANVRGWDRTLLDEGTKVLNGKWTGPELTRSWQLTNIGGLPPDKSNPAHFIRFKDPQGENARVILDGAGKPYVPVQVDTCAQCPDGTTKDWILSETKAGPIRLVHTSGCNYVDDATVVPRPGYSAELTHNGTTWELTIILSTGTELTYLYAAPPDFPATVWACFGTNRMQLQPGIGFESVGWPEIVYLSSGEQAMPGKIRVEHYNETNFFLLGIPAILG